MIGLRLLFLFIFPLFLIHSSLPDEQYDNLECQVEEYNLRIGILSDEPFALLEEVGDVDDVRLVDEAGEVLGEVFLFLRHVVQFRQSEVVHEAFPEHVHEVIEHSLLLLSSEGGNHFAPFLQVVNISHVGESHQHDKHVEMLSFLIAGIEFFQCCIPVAVGDAGYPVCHVGFQSPAFYQCLLDVL